MGVAEKAGIQMTKEYFKIEAFKLTPQYGFRKGLKLFGGEGYQAAKEELKSKFSEEDILAYYTGRTITQDTVISIASCKEIPTQ